LHGDEVFFRIKIVFARLVDDPNLMELGGCIISDDLIKLPQLERSSIVLILDANHKSRLGSRH